MSSDSPITTSDPLKICVVGSTYPRHEDDYAVPWLRESVARLVARGHEVVVLAPSYEALETHTIDDVEVVRFRYAPKSVENLTHEQGAPNKINRWYRQALGVPYVAMGRRAAIKLARERNFDVIHAHWPFPHEPIGTAAAAACNAPLVMTCHGAEFALARRKKWVAEILKRSLRKADALIANSNDTMAHIKNLSGCTADVIPFGTTVKAKPYVPTLNEVPRILFTGRLIERKGVEYLIRAMPKMLAKQPVQLIITGDGDQREMLEQEATRLGVEQQVRFLGFVSNDQLNEEYANCDVWVNPSVIDSRGDTEGLGVGSIEAYAHQKPVVASNVGGIPDTIQHGLTGWLVPEKDPQALASAIMDLVENPHRAASFGQAGLSYAVTAFNWEHLTTRIESCYRRVLGRSLTEECLTEECLTEDCELSELHRMDSTDVNEVEELATQAN